MRLLLTGAAGYTGKGLAEVLSTRHIVRGLDVVDRPAPVAEMMVGDIADLDVCRRAVAGVEALVLCHMAPNPRAYETPPAAYDANVKGTANLYHAAVEAGIKRVVMISTTGLLFQDRPDDARPGDGPYNFNHGRYALTKLMQEVIARHHFEADGVATAMLRPAWIVYDGERGPQTPNTAFGGPYVTKYGQKVEKRNGHLIDPRDIGAAVLLALDLPDLKCEAFNIGQDDFPWDQTATRTRLKWRATYTFDGLPR